MKIPSSNLGKTCCVQKLFLIYRTIFLHNIFSPCSAKRRASDKDLHVLSNFKIEKCLLTLSWVKLYLDANAIKSSVMSSGSTASVYLKLIENYDHYIIINKLGKDRWKKPSIYGWFFTSSYSNPATQEKIMLKYEDMKLKVRWFHNEILTSQVFQKKTNFCPSNSKQYSNKQNKGTFLR